MPRTGHGYEAGADIHRASANHPKTGAQTAAHFAKPARKPRRKRAETPKTILKTARRAVKTLNKGPKFRMFDTLWDPFSIRLAK